MAKRHQVAGLEQANQKLIREIELKKNRIQRYRKIPRNRNMRFAKG